MSFKRTPTALSLRLSTKRTQRVLQEDNSLHLILRVHQVDTQPQLHSSCTLVLQEDSTQESIKRTQPPSPSRGHNRSCTTAAQPSSKWTPLYPNAAVTQLHSSSKTSLQLYSQLPSAWIQHLTLPFPYPLPYPTLTLP